MWCLLSGIWRKLTELLRHRTVFRFIFADITPAVAVTGEGLYEGLEWLCDAIARKKSGEEAQKVIETGKEKLTGNYVTAVIKQLKNYLAPVVKSP